MCTLLLNLSDENTKSKIKDKKEKENYNQKENQWIKKKQQLTLLDMNCPNGSGRMVTKPLSASSKTVADTVVLIGTPSLLSCMEKVNDEKEGKPEKGRTKQKYLLPLNKRKGLKGIGREANSAFLPKKCCKHCIDGTQTWKIQLQLLAIWFNSLQANMK